MREILFRGKRVDNGEWVEGQLLHFIASVGTRELAVIVESCEWDNSNEWFNLCKRAKVIPETVGQYTGLTDKNGKKIFEGDIMPVYEQGEEYYYKVVYNGDCFMLAMLDSEQGSYPLSAKNAISEVIGNIHDNREFLKGGEG